MIGGPAALASGMTEYHPAPGSFRRREIKLQDAVCVRGHDEELEIGPADSAEIRLIKQHRPVPPLELSRRDPSIRSCFSYNEVNIVPRRSVPFCER